MYKRQVDITPISWGGVVDRGNQRPNINTPTESFVFDLRDDTSDVIEWRGTFALQSPNVNTPVRCGFLDEWGAWHPLYKGKILRMFDIHDTSFREITIESFGNKADLATAVLDPDRPAEDAETRIDSYLTEIGWNNGIDASYPPADLGTFGLLADLDTAPGRAPIIGAYNEIQKAANSAGYKVGITRAGEFKLDPIVYVDDPTNYVIADCYDDAYPDISAVAVTMTFAADASELLNTVIVGNEIDPTFSAEALDATSISLWGRKTQGYGFPILVANDNLADAQALADTVVAQYSDIITRCENVTFNTRSDPAWWDVLADLELGQSITIRRLNPRPITFNAHIIGVVININENGYLEGVINLATTDTTE